MGRLSGLNGERVLRAFVRMGWRVVRVHGSHHVLEAPGRRTLVLPIHRGRAMKEGTLRGVLGDAGVSVEDFFAAY